MEFDSQVSVRKLNLFTRTPSTELVKFVAYLKRCAFFEFLSDLMGGLKCILHDIFSNVV